ncbi:MAG: glycine--tRNA ligase subunit beta [Caldilineaceae bacterium]
MSQKPPSMQEVIMRLHNFWAAHGCLIWQPYSEKVGAGTMNPGTVLRVLGPEPWNVAYVEPSFRPDDGRFAENPNRMQMHHQYQVILKPDPGNPQELYLASLEAFGLDRTKHDIRFVEDNWESPALGAWGLGWEVWLDGQEITQFTYFQQSGSLTLDPVSVEITYGLDRIVMALQGKTQVWDIDVDGVHRYDEIYKSPEIENCVYEFELADVQRLKQLYEIYRLEAEACIKRGLVIPAHDFVLKQSHTFNLLDSRGAIGVTERAKFFGAMRAQARQVSELYVKQREREEFPWLKEADRETGRQEDKRAHFAQSANPQSTIRNPQSFLLEIGSEELPPDDVVAGIAQVEEKLKGLLTSNKISFDSIYVSGTPRRLVAHVKGLSPMQADEVVEKRGPALTAAFDSLGQVTKAAEGFARGQGLTVDKLEKREGYLYAVKTVKGQPTAVVLPKLCSDLFDSLRWGKTMRWNSSGLGYPRPLRWIVALYGDAVVPFSWAEVESGRTSRGPRFADAAAQLPPGGFTTFEIADADSYFEAVKAQGIVLDRQERKQRIVEQIAQVAKQAGGVTSEEPALLEEVTDLVEAPQALLGSFEEKYLDVPMPVLIGVMKKHQRYFPVLRPLPNPPLEGREQSRGGELLPHFITVANANALPYPDVVVQGNEGVIRARYADAAYFYRADTGRSLESFTPRLGTLTFQEKLGSMLDKVNRLKELSPQIAEALEATTDQKIDTIRAAELSKSDLVTNMVVEMTSLQGIMGEIYALKSGESKAVAKALREHYLPRSAGDANPESKPGLALSLADKIDSIIGLFAVGAIPTGSADPFGLRRAALGIVNNLLAAKADFSVRNNMLKAAVLQPVQVAESAINEAVSFVEKRLEGVLLEVGFTYDIVAAVLAVRGDNPFKALRACEELSELIKKEWWSESFTAYARCARITRSVEKVLELDASAYVEEVESKLHEAYLEANLKLADANEPADKLGSVLKGLQKPINAYFDKVLVNAEDAALRNARLALVQSIARLPEKVADLSKLQGF